jgi:probable rRNA maturation factor
MSLTWYCTVKRTPYSKKQISAIIVKTLTIANKNYNADVSVHCIGDMAMTTLNNKHRGKNYPTDVLSFPTEDKQDIGDIFLCIPQIVRQAKEHKVSVNEECVRMLVHGVLHLVGYDHGSSAQSGQMFNLQEKIVSLCNKK